MGGVHWMYVCETDPAIDEVETATKTDGFDGAGHVLINGQYIGAPYEDATNEYVDGVFVTTLIDKNVNPGSGGLVDVFVTREISNSYVYWSITVYDAGTDTLRTDVPVTFAVGLGSDGSTDWFVDPDGQHYRSAGDINDPIVLWYLSDPAFTLTTSPGNDYPTVTFTTHLEITLAVVDYGCNDYDAALPFADGLLPTFQESFGSVLALPGAVSCFSTPDLTFAPGQAIDESLPVSFLPDTFDWSEGGDFWTEGLPDFLHYETNDEDGAAPTFTLIGTAPAEPGTYVFALYVGTDGNDNYRQSRIFVTITIAKPLLAATGSDGSGLLAGALGLALLGGALLMRARRRAI
jgi:hypothetical protein